MPCNLNAIAVFYLLVLSYPRESREAYLQLLRTVASALPSSDVTAIITYDDIEREVPAVTEEERDKESPVTQESSECVIS
eukprot:m.108676 g.108676  ORF g.108676 m.108676 type:complete len:80 (+) comp15216_c1_seq1:55-294(+)